MAVLLCIACVCGLGLIGLGTLLGLAIQRRPGRQRAIDALRRSSIYAVSSSRTVAITVRPRRRAHWVLHPRMDLAAGQVPPHQAVDLDRQQRRDAAMQATAHRRRTPVFQPFDRRRTGHGTYRQRLDLMYASASMGDLSDPVAGSGPRTARVVAHPRSLA